MARKAKKMVALNVEETSGVDHPAHLQEGWMVMKSVDATDILSVLEPLDETLKTPESNAQADETATKEDLMSNEVEKSADDLLKDANASLEQATARIKELEAELEKAMHDGKKKKKPMMMADEMDEEETEEMKMKRMKKEAPEPLRKMLEDLEKSATEAKQRAEEAEAVLMKERDDRADAEAVDKAKGWSHLPIDATKLGPALRRLALQDSELAKSIEDVLTAVNAQSESANIFAELGKSVDATVTGNAVDQLTSLAKSAVDNGTSATFEQAFSDAIIANPSLYSQYLAEKRA